MSIEIDWNLFNTTVEQKIRELEERLDEHDKGMDCIEEWMNKHDPIGYAACDGSMMDQEVSK